MRLPLIKYGNIALTIITIHRVQFLQDHWETDRFFAVSGVQLAQSTSGLFHFRRVAFSVTLKTKVGSTLTKAAALRITLNIDGTPTRVDFSDYRQNSVSF
jgi:hypothetical protein